MEDLPDESDGSEVEEVEENTSDESESAEIEGTIPTSASEIIEHLLGIHATDESIRNKSYALRYWLSVIMFRWRDKLIVRDLQSKFGIPRTTITTYSKKTFDPSPRNKYPATTAEAIVEALSSPGSDIAITDNYFNLRLWLSAVICNIMKSDRSVDNLHMLLGVSQSKIRRGATNGLTPASQGFLAATDSH